MTDYTAKIAHFSVTGEYLTRVARDIFLSDMPSKAWRLLVTSLISDTPGEAEHVAAKLLDGKLKLIGDSASGIGATEDTDSAGYIKAAKFIYAGRVKVNGRWWQPRAEVTDVGPDDARYAMKKCGPVPTYMNTKGMEDFGRIRTEFYSQTGECVLDVTRKRGKQHYEDFVIFKPVGEPPAWWQENTTPTDALNAFLKAGNMLERESWSDTFGEIARNVKSENDDDDESLADESSASESPADESYTSESSASELSPSAKAAVAKANRAIIEARNAFIDAKYAEEDARRKAERDDIRKRVLDQVAQTNTGTIELRNHDGALVKIVPRAPFMNWALRRTPMKHLAPPWSPVSRSGMKLPLDDPYHTDWWLGAGLELDESVYGGDVQDAAFHTMFELQRKLGNFECAVIVAGDDVSGVIGKEIVVLPDLHPDRLEAMSKALAVITEAGGAMAHLAQVALERRIPIVMVPDACVRYRDGMTVTICPSDGMIDADMSERRSERDEIE